MTWGERYVCSNTESAVSLFCTKLLDQIKRYLIKNQSVCGLIAQNFSKLLQGVICDDQLNDVFREVGNYGINATSHRDVFKCICKMLQSANDFDESLNIRRLTELMLFIMFCSAPDKKHYLVIDNIEEYIKLDSIFKIQILDADIEKIFKAIRQVESRIRNIFDDMPEDYYVKTFKIIIVLRRTSLRQLGLDGLTCDLAVGKNVHDMTGHISISDIWDNKNKWVWKPFLENLYDEDSHYLFGLINDVMHDGKSKLGFGYQQLIAPLVCHSIRRGAKSQVHSVSETFRIISNDNDETTINRSIFEVLRDKTKEAKYMYRMALLQFQFKQYISVSNGQRWKWLNIGHIMPGDVQIRTNHLEIAGQRVQYFDEYRVTLMRRILTVLSQESEITNSTSSGRTAVDMFETISLYSLMKGVFAPPIGELNISQEDYLASAQILISLSDMAFKDTKGAPFAMLQFKNFEGGEVEFAHLLRRIVEAGELESGKTGRYNRMNYGVRITTAGYAFLYEWQASFPFMESLYCYTIPPLFFLKNGEIINHVITTVYNQADALCRRYESEARAFCGVSSTLINGNYLPKHLGADITFRKRVRDLHCKHLDLYRNYVKENGDILGFDEKQKEKILTYVQSYIEKYMRWDVSVECF